VARAIHYNSARRERPLFTINCTSLSSSLIESELFGHRHGSFTGATEDRKGLFEDANGSTLFLDEIGDMPLETQAKILRVLQEREFERVGGNRSIAVDVRILAATNQDLEARVGDGRFREDLYYRLNVIHIRVPSLRERREDIPQFLNFFLDQFSRQYAVNPPTISSATLSLLTQYAWPGNVRELKNIVERLVVRASDNPIEPRDLPLEVLRGSAMEQPPAAPSVAPTVTTAPARHASDALFERMVNGGESFWSAVYTPFMSRDLTRDDVRAIVRRGLERTGGNYRVMVELFNMPTDDYKRFLGVLRKYQCHMPFQQFRSAATTRPGVKEQAGEPTQPTV